jgi:hypothetical protein
VAAKSSRRSSATRFPELAVPRSVITFASEQGEPIDALSSRLPCAVNLAEGSSASHADAVHICPGGEIGPHPAGFDQLFLVVHGAGWVAGRDRVRQQLGTFQGAFIPKGELHSKGSEVGLTASMLQAEQVLVHQLCTHTRAGSLHEPDT